MKLGEILENSFNLPWRNRFLVFYGVLIALFTGGYGLSNNLNWTINSEEMTGRFAFLANEAFAIAASIGVIIIAILGFLVALWAEANIILAIGYFQAKKKIERAKIEKVSRAKFGKLVVLNFVLPFFIALVLVLVTVPLVYLFYKMPQPTGLVTGIVVGAVLLLALIPALIYLGLAWGLAIRYIVLEDTGAVDALRLALALIKKRFWRTFGFAILFGLIAGAGAGAASLPLILLGGSAYYAFSVGNMSVSAGIAILTVMYYVVYLGIVGYFQAFSQTGWTLWWYKLKAEKIENAKEVAVKKSTKKQTSSKNN